MEWLWIIVGVVVILLGLRDVFHTLFHPSGQGAISRGILSFVWRVSKTGGRRPGTLVGPVGIVLVIVAWVAMQVLGWALVYLPSVPQGFTYSPGISPERYADFAEAVYISLMTLSTLGYGDVVAVQPVLRPIAPLEALTGFVLFTGAVSWLLQLYPALGRQRSLALRLTALERSGFPARLPETDGTVSTLYELAGQFAQIRVDLGQNSETYYFAEEEDATSLPLAMRTAGAISNAAIGSGSAPVETAGRALQEAVDDLADLMRRQFLPKSPDGADAVIEAAMADHGHPRDAT